MKRSTSFAQEPMQLDLDREDGKISTAIEMIVFSSSILFLGNEWKSVDDWIEQLQLS